MMGSFAPSKPELPAAIRLTVYRSDGWTACRELAPGDTLTVGSNPGCGLCLEGPAVAPIHCILKFVEGGLWVQDWYSSGGTQIDGRPVSEETRVLAGETIELGPYSIRTTSPQVADIDLDVAASANSFAQICESELSGGEWDSFPAESATGDEAASFEPLRSFERETIELLRAEVAHLQQELAIREQQLADAQSFREPTATAGEAAVGDSEETARLVARMETLLDELDESDERVAQLEQHLRHAEEAAVAEREERRHLESWVGDIERRFGQREAEWQAEREQLLQQLSAATDQPRRSEQEPPRRLAAGGGPLSTADEVLALRQQNARLQQQLAQLQRELEQRVEQPPPADRPARDGDGDASPADDLREEHVRLAQERALLARQQAEFAAVRAEFERLVPSQRRPDDDGDTRLRALRDHLREIHVQEQRAQCERSLGARLAQLWRRLEGRP